MKNLVVGLVGVAAAICGSEVQGATPAKTNTWANAEGVEVIKNWNDAANWSAEGVPTAESWTKIQESASITLQNGDDLHSGRTWLLAGVRSKDLDLKIPTGAKLSLDGVSESTALGCFYGGQDGSPWESVNNNDHVTIDVAGGELVFGQNVLGMRGPCVGGASTTFSDVIRVGNGGVFSVTNGAVWFSSGIDQGNWTGVGSESNVIEVAKGGTLRVSGPGYLQFGGNWNGPSAAGDSPTYGGGGWINVCGGKLDCTGCTATRPLQMSTAKTATVGGNLIVSEGGLADFGGKTINVVSRGKNLIRVADGGMLTNVNLVVNRGDADAGTYDNRFEIDGGDVYLNRFACGADTTKNDGRLTILIRGSESKFRAMNTGSYLAWHYNGNAIPYFMDFRLAAHTPRTADYPVAPYGTIGSRTSGNPYNFDSARVHGFNRLSPDGGLQLAHAKTFTLVAHAHDTGPETSHLAFSNTYGGLIGDEMWRTNCVVQRSAQWIKYVGSEYVYAFTVTLKDDARIEDGVVLENPVPRAWLPLPKFAARQINPLKTERVSVRLGLVPQGVETLESLVAKMRANGHDSACVDDSVAGYNVRVDLPMDELAADVSDDSIVMDFVQIDSYAQACGTLPYQTNALIRAASCEVKKIDRGLVINVH